jgi:hypothetical protein
VYQPQDSKSRESLHGKRLREELHRRFPPETGYEVSEATWIEIVDGEPEVMPVTMVTGGGVALTFFPRAPKNPPGTALQRDQRNSARPEDS